MSRYRIINNLYGNPEDVEQEIQKLKEIEKKRDKEMEEMKDLKDEKERINVNKNEDKNEDEKLLKNNIIEDKPAENKIL